MASIRVHGGDFLKGVGSFHFGQFVLKTKEHPWGGERIPLSQLAEVAIASEENGRSLLRGAVGAALFGPVGLLMAGNKKNVTFAAQFKDGRKMLATTDNDTYLKMAGAVFK
jgi:hypothetical protein